MTVIQLRRGTAAQWTAGNRVLAAGEAGVETDTGQEKIGDGIRPWNSLPYVGGSLTKAGVIATGVLASDLGGVTSSSLAAETSRATAAEGTLTTAVSAEATARIAGDALAIPLTQKAAASGVASLDSGGQVPLGQLGNVPASGVTKAGVIATGVLATDLSGASASALTAETSARTAADALLAPLASPTFTGTPVFPQSVYDAIMPWTISVNAIVGATDAVYTQGVWTANPALANQLGGGQVISSGTQNDEIGWHLNLAAGTWTVAMLTWTAPNRGITTVNLDGAAQGTVDCYSIGTTYNVFSKVSGIVVPTNGKHLLSFKGASKNASSSGYYVGLSAFQLRRTA